MYSLRRKMCFLCDQGRASVGSTPFVHFYGQAQWVGKSQIGNWLRDFIAAIPDTAREEFPAVLAQLRNKRPWARDEHTSCRRNIAAIQKKAGQSVQYKEKDIPEPQGCGEGHR